VFLRWRHNRANEPHAPSAAPTSSSCTKPGDVRALRLHRPGLGRPRQPRAHPARPREGAPLAGERPRLYSCSVGFLTEFDGVIDFSPDFADAACRDFAGKLFGVPCHQHKGHPAYWWCTHSPLYRRYLDKRLADTMKAGADGLHIDDYRGTSGSVTWLAGGFCPHCMAAFRDSLASHTPKEKLAALGIANLPAFDYRQFLLDRGAKPEEYSKRRAGLPLADEFYTFHVMANVEFVAQYRSRGEPCVRPKKGEYETRPYGASPCRSAPTRSSAAPMPSPSRPT
jgi:hypothetical protein